MTRARDNSAILSTAPTSSGAILQTDLTKTNNFSWAGPEFMPGRNKFLNGDFSVWQRGGTFSFTSANSYGYAADRWFCQSYVGDGGSGSNTLTVTQQTFTPGSAPVAGYEGSYFLRYALSAVGTLGTTNGMQRVQQNLEDVRTFAGQTVTVSFWAKAAVATNITVCLQQQFGTGGSPTVNVPGSVTSIPITTSWARYSSTFSLPSIAGQTIGTGSLLEIAIVSYKQDNITFSYPSGQFGTNTPITLDLWGMQIESGSSVSPFTSSGGNYNSELQLCQKYYWRSYSSGTNNPLTITGICNGSLSIFIQNPVPMRISSGFVIDFSNIVVLDTASTYPITAGTATQVNSLITSFNLTASGLTAYRPALVGSGSGGGWIGVSADI